MRKLFFTIFSVFVFFTTVKAQWTQLNNTRLEVSPKNIKTLEKIETNIKILDKVKIDSKEAPVSIDDSVVSKMTSIKSIDLNDEKNRKNAVEQMDKIQTNIARSKISEKEKYKLKSEIESLQRKLEKITNKNTSNEKDFKNQLANVIQELNNYNEQISYYFKKEFSNNLRFYLLQKEFKIESIKSQCDEVNTYIQGVNTIKLFDTTLSKADWQSIMPTYINFIIKGEKLAADTLVLKNAFNEYVSLLEGFKKYEIFFDDEINVFENKEIKAKIEKQLKALEQTETALTDSINSTTKKIKLVAEFYNSKVDAINKTLEKYKAVAKKSIGDYDALANFSKILDENGAGVPGINILGNYTYGSASNVGGFAKWQLFTGVAGINNSNTYFNLFVPEASTYGFNALFNLGFTAVSDKSKESKKNIGIFLETNFLGKTVKLTDSLKANTFLIHTKLGAEIIFLRNIFSLRGVINNINIGNQFAEIKKHKTGISSNIWFVNIGLSAMMELNEDKDFMLKFDLDIIPVKKDLENYIGLEKQMIPQLKIGIIKKV